jgi:hypothetical protein
MRASSTSKISPVLPIALARLPECLSWQPWPRNRQTVLTVQRSTLEESLGQVSITHPARQHSLSDHCRWLLTSGAYGRCRQQVGYYVPQGAKASHGGAPSMGYSGTTRSSRMNRSRSVNSPGCARTGRSLSTALRTVAERTALASRVLTADHWRALSRPAT